MGISGKRLFLGWKKIDRQPLPSISEMRKTEAAAGGNGKSSFPGRHHYWKRVATGQYHLSAGYKFALRVVDELPHNPALPTSKAPLLD